MFQIPKQKLARSRKTKEWAKECIRAFINRSSFSTSTKHTLQTYYEAYNGNLREADYNYVTNPYNSEAWSKKNFPARLRNYNILKPVVDLLLGEKAKRPLAYQVVVRNADISSRFDQYRKKKIDEYMEQLIINTANENGIETGVPSQELPVPEEHMEAVLEGYRDSRAIIGQEALNYLFDWLGMEDNMQKLFFDWLVAGECYTYKDVCMDDVEYSVVSPLDIDFEKGPDVDYIEDADWVVRRQIMSVNQVVDRFYDVLAPKDIDRLEKPHGKYRDSHGGVQSMFINKPEDDESDRMVEVLHVCWKSFSRVGILEYTDDLGQPQQMVVDESYKAADNETIKFYWVNEVWEGYQIDKDIYVSFNPHAVQRNEMNNISVCKMPYNGRIYSNRHSDNISVVSMGLAYQVLYNVFHYRLELSIAKNKDKIMLMEMNTIPKRHGWDEEKFMYYADAMGFAFIDSTAEGKSGERVTFNQFQVLDMSLGQYIAAQFQLLQAIKAEWEEMIGISRQRKGQVKTSDGVGTTERAVFQSSVISEEIFRRFEAFIEKEYQGLLDVSKIAWRKGKKMTYVTSDLRTAVVDIDPTDFQEAEYGVFVKNTSREQDKLTQMRNLAMAFAQNGSEPSTVAEILDSNNFAKIKVHLKEVEQKQKEFQEQQNQVQQQLAQQQAAAQKQLQDEKQAFESSENEKDRLVKMELKKMDVAAKVTSDADGNGRRDEIDRQRLEVERQKVEVQKQKS
tara:strand:- start:1415 stop:3613 length:2199 start_codon:yes stop_codon:yes gene_type:complete